MISNSKEKVSSLKEKVEILEIESDDQEQYSRRNCILVHGIKENRFEITNELVPCIIKKTMDIELSEKDIKRSYRTGNTIPRKKKLLIVKSV